MAMQKQMLQPQEIEVFYIIPTIRSHLAKYMKELGKSQKGISQLLQIRESTVSHYINEKRAHKVEFNKEVEEEIKISASRIKDKWTLLSETQRLLGVIRRTDTLCQIHKQFASVPEGCNIQQIGCA